MNATCAGIIIIDRVTEEIMFVNRAAIDSFGPLAARLKSDHLTAEYYATDASGERISIHELLLRRSAQDERLNGHEFNWHTPTGVTSYTVSTKALAPLQGLATGVLLTFQEVSEIKATELVLAQALYGEQIGREEAEKAIELLRMERELREQFVSSLTHDLRTPLSAARMATQLVARSLSDPQRLQMLSAKVLHNIDRADHMIRDLLDANQVRAGQRLPLQLENLDLRTVVTSTLDDLITIHGDRFILEGEEKLEGCWDRRGLRRILENLCNNAVKYGFEHEPIRVTLSHELEQVRISVHNEGEPLPLQSQSKLFQYFHRTEEAQASGKRGWGIGLMIVRGVAESHGGYVEVKSAPEQGTTFTVTLPRDSRAFWMQRELKAS